MTNAISVASRLVAELRDGTASKDLKAWTAEACVTMQRLVDLAGARTAPEPDFEAVRDKRMSELSAPQLRDAQELWIRDQLGWLGGDKNHIRFLLERLDESRGIAPSPSAGALRPPIPAQQNGAVELKLEAPASARRPRP
jgi:hypothetical protein